MPTALADYELDVNPPRHSTQAPSAFPTPPFPSGILQRLLRLSFLSSNHHHAAHIFSRLIPCQLDAAAHVTKEKEAI